MGGKNSKGKAKGPGRLDDEAISIVEQVLGEWSDPDVVADETPKAAGHFHVGDPVGYNKTGEPATVISIEAPQPDDADVFLSIKMVANDQVREVPGAGLTSRRVLPKAVVKKATGPACTTVLAELTKWAQLFADRLLADPAWAAKFTDFDAPTKAAFEAAGVDPASLGGNSGAFWGESPFTIKAARTQIIDAIRVAAGGYEPTPEQKGEATYIIMGHLVRVMFQSHGGHNIGAVPLKGMTTPDGKPVLLVRTQAMADSGAKGSCFRTLIETGVVKHVNNLYNGHFPIMDFIDGEVSICAAARKKSKSNVPTFMDERANKVTRKWRRMVDEKDEWSDPQRMRNAMALCADQINDILRPDGKSPVGGILLHCAGGMHRTGIIYALIRRHVNDDPIEDIIDDYKRHVDWKSDDQPGGFEALNVRFIKEFDVSLLASDSVVFEEGFEREDALPKRKAAAPFKRAARALLVAGHMSGGLFE